MDQILDILLNLKLAVDFNKEDLEYLATNSTLLYLDKDKLLMEVGKYNPELYIICNGQVKIFFNSNLIHDDNSKLLTYLNPGDILGEMELYEDRDNIANASTTKATTVISIPKNVFKKRLLDRSELNFLFIKFILSKWKKNEYLYVSLIQKYEELIKKNQEQQEKLDYERNLKENFIINISHELRTPLTVIQGILDSPDTTSEKIYFPIDLYSKMRRSNRFLLDLINDLLDFTFLTEGNFILKPEWYEYDLIGERINDLNEVASKKGLDLNYLIQHYKTNDNLSLFLNIDIKRINQIILNLLSNAIKFTEKGEIKVLIQTKDFIENECVLLISVKDTGIGISPEDQEKIFNKFVRIQKKYDSIEGTGLGLSIVKTLVTLMNGKIKVNSALNIGSEFIVEIPVQYKLNKKYQNKEKKEIELTNNNEIRNILIVDDFPDTHIIIKEMTKNIPLKIFSIFDGNSILDMISKQDFDIILLDLMLPLSDGYFFLEILKKYYKNDSLRKIPRIIAFTALATQNELEKIYSKGFDGHLFKPFTKDELIETIFAFL